MNSRKYPRTMNEAFTKTAEYGAAIERPARNNYRYSAWVILVCCLCLVLMASGCGKKEDFVEKEFVGTYRKLASNEKLVQGRVTLTSVTMDDGTRCVVSYVYAESRHNLVCDFSKGEK